TQPCVVHPAQRPHPATKSLEVDVTIPERLRRYVGRVPNPISSSTKATHARSHGAQVGVSVCPYCAVGCSQLVYSESGRVIDIEGDDDRPINAGTPCAQGAATFSVVNSPRRLTKVTYRAPESDHWEERSLGWAMEQIARGVKETR